VVIVISRGEPAGTRRDQEGPREPKGIIITFSAGGLELNLGRTINEKVPIGNQVAARWQSWW
jgi:hypothetical protein